MGDSTLKGRDAKTGQFIPVKDARERPNTTVVERVPLPGKGRNNGAKRNTGRAPKGARPRTHSRGDMADMRIDKFDVIQVDRTAPNGKELEHALNQHAHDMPYQDLFSIQTLPTGWLLVYRSKVER